MSKEELLKAQLRGSGGSVRIGRGRSRKVIYHGGVRTEFPMCGEDFFGSLIFFFVRLFPEIDRRAEKGKKDLHDPVHKSEKQKETREEE